MTVHDKRMRAIIKRVTVVGGYGCVVVTSLVQALGKCHSLAAGPIPAASVLHRWSCHSEDKLRLYGGEKQIQSVIRREDVFSNIGEQVAQVRLKDSKGSWPPSHGRSQYCLLLTKPPVSLQRVVGGSAQDSW